jgi:serine/threonine protein kinase
MPSQSEQLILTIGVKNNLLTREEAVNALEIQRSHESGGESVRIEQILLEKGYLTEKQIKLIRSVLPQVTGREPTQLQPAVTDEGTENKPPAPANPKEPIPGYGIQGKLGVGGMATVFRAEHFDTGETVALKILQPQQARNPAFVERFLREAKLLSEFEHKNLVRCFDFGKANGLYYMSLEFVDGRSVQDMLDQEKTLPEAVALDYILQITEALVYIQSNNIVHRDIKPDNVLVTQDELVKLCDLGFAQSIDGDEGDPAESELTSGTPQYMSPEQARGRQDIDVRSDIYSLGATLWHMVMGEVPFAGDDNMEVMAKQVLEELNSAEVKNRRISTHMHYFIERMMAKEVELRYQSAQEILDDIGEHLQGLREIENINQQIVDRHREKSGPVSRPRSERAGSGRTRRAGTSRRTKSSRSSRSNRPRKKR